MKGEKLADQLRAILLAHPDVRKSAAGHAGYIERYRTTDGRNIGLETRGEGHRNLFVESASIALWRLQDLKHQHYFAKDYATNRPNSNLFHADAFGDVDITRFLITDVWQAVRVLVEVAGLRART